LKERGKINKRGANAPLKHPFLWLFSKGIKRDESPFKKFSSLSPYEGERDKG